jgi:hypothetical protein
MLAVFGRGREQITSSAGQLVSVCGVSRMRSRLIPEIMPGTHCGRPKPRASILLVGWTEWSHPHLGQPVGSRCGVLDVDVNPDTEPPARLVGCPVEVDYLLGR